MKKIVTIIASLTLVYGTSISCSNSDFAEDYNNPAKVSEVQLSQMYTGALQSIKDYIIPSYTRYFVVEQPWMAPFTQAVGRLQTTDRYKVGSGAIDQRWSAYYEFLGQYREFENLYNALDEQSQENYKIYSITAKIFMYDQTQKMVDLWGDIPWSEAGYLADYGNDYLQALPKYDKAEDIYTKMLDDLKIFADELSTITLSPGVQTVFKTQDFINLGDVHKWQQYCNSLRLRMLTRISEVPAFQARYQQEVSEILSNPSQYPIVLDNADNIQLTIYNNAGGPNSEGWNQGIGSEGWNLDISSKSMIDFMNANNDPRRRVLFEPNVDGIYRGLDNFENYSQQNNLVNDGKISIYNRTTFHDNLNYPGVIITASEVNLLIAEYYLNQNGYNDGTAEQYYNQGVRESINFHFAMQALSTNSSRGGVATPLQASEISDYLNEPGVKWADATSNQQALNLIAHQRWVHFNIVQNLQNWAAYRRVGLPQLSFPDDQSSTQQQPPVRWTYSSSEKSQNAENYEAVEAQDNLNTRIFWDLQ